MSTVASARSHLVERAVEALGGLGKPQDWRPGRGELPAPAPHPATPADLPTVAPGPAAPPAAPPIALDTLREAGLMVTPDSPVRSRTLEEMAVIQHQVLRIVQETSRPGSPRGRIVLVTSALRAEGKTFTALNLAARIATAGGQNVVLVDADGRQGGVSHALGRADAPGLRQLAADPSRRAASLPLRTALDRLSFLGYGAGPAGERDLPSGATLTAAVLRLAADLPHHVIVLDTPPSLSTSDASTLASLAGQVILVVNAERTQRNEVEAALDMLEACPMLQLLLNRVRFSANDTFGAHGDYGVPDAG